MATTKTHILKKRMLEALQKSLGIVTTAAKSVGIDRGRHYDWMRKDKKYKESVENIEGIALDFAESKLHGMINEGNVPATIFYLKTKGKKRGYIEKQINETTIKGGGINIDIVLPDGDIK